MRGLIFVGAAAVVVIAAGCGRERSDRFPGVMWRVDGGGSSMSDGAPADDAPSATRDGGGIIGSDAGGGGTDAGGGPGVDAGTQGTCDPSCLAMSEAFCCTECGCGGASGACAPVCAAPFMWDCEIGCCFDYDTFECACPAGTSWDAERSCCADTGGTCVPAP